MNKFKMHASVDRSIQSNNFIKTNYNKNPIN